VTLRTRTLAALGVTLAGLAVTLPVVTSAILDDRFESLERSEAHGSVVRVQDTLAAEARQLGEAAQTWASSGEVWDYARGRAPRFGDTNLNAESLEALRLDAVVVTDLLGGVVWGGRAAAGEIEAPDANAVAALIGEGAGRAPAWAGMVSVAGQPWLVARRPIRPLDRAASAGTLVFARELGEARVAELAAVTDLDVSILSYPQAAARFGWNRLPDVGEVHIGAPEVDMLPVTAALAGGEGEPVAVASVRLPRTVWQAASEARTWINLALVGVTALLACVAAAAVEYGVLAGLGSLAVAVGRIGRIGAAGARLVVSGGDELSLLAARINRMLDDLERAEVARTRSDRRLALALDAAQDGWWDWDVQAREVYFSPRWCTMLGFSPKEVASHPGAALQLVHPEDRTSVEARLLDHLRGRIPSFEAELRMRTSTGEWAWVLARGRVVERDTTGRAVRMVGTQVDISERKSLETRLVMSDRLAAVGTLAAGVAHEINNPLAYVMTNLDVAREALRGKPGLGGSLDALDEAAQGAVRVRDIVRDMKLFARDGVELTAVDVRRVVSVALRMAGAEARGRARLVTEFGELPLVTATDAGLGQVVMNLVINAIQAMPTERAADQNEILVRARRSGNAEVILEVRDNGVGMDAALQRRIFDPFFTTKAVGVGTGLGLYVSHNLVASFGGRMELVSVVGEGTTFRITVPIHRGAAVPIPSAPKLVPSRRTRVLIIDDEPAIASAMKRALGDTYEVVVAGDGRAALVVLAADRDFDVLMCDVVMPDLDGPSFYAALATAAPELVPRVVFTSGGAPNPNVQAFLEAVPNRRLEKPFSMDELRGVVGTAAA